MSPLTRRTALGTTLAAGASLLLPRGPRAAVQAADVPAPSYPIEQGASLRVLRPTKFVQGDEDLWMANTAKFTEATGVQVTVDREGWEDLRPKTAIAANVGSGPDIILMWQEDPYLYQDKILDLTDLATYLGQRYGGWFPVAEKYGMPQPGVWKSIPVGGSGSTLVHRKSMIQAAGFEKVPGDLPGLLQLFKALQAKGTPAGFALGNAVGDGGWTDWLLWAHDSSLVDENDQVVIDNPKTIEALEYAKELSSTFVPGTAAWLDPSNNKAFLSGQVSLTNNGISVYYAAKTSDDPATKALAEDIDHAPFPIGPVGRPTEGALVINACVMGYTPAPNAAKAYLMHMMEAPQYAAWQTAAIGYWCHPLQAYDGTDVWASDPKIGAYKDVMRNALPQSWKGTPGEKAAAAKAELITLNMFQEVCVNDMAPKEAAAEAQRRAERIYRSA